MLFRDVVILIRVTQDVSYNEPEKGVTTRLEARDDILIL